VFAEQPSLEVNTMANFLAELASGAGVEGDQAHHGVGALLAMLKDRLDPGAFSKLKDCIPNAEHMQSAFESQAQPAGGGLLGAVESVAGKFLGGGGEDPGGALQSQFASVGLSADHLRSLLPKLHELLADKLPPDVLTQIQAHVPGFGPPAEQAVESSPSPAQAQGG
jgi:hypothetical protein